MNLEKTSWTALASMYGNPYFTEEKGATLSPEVLAEWWKVFHDDTLDSLIYTALDHNRDLAQAESRLKQAREALGMTKASLVPWVNACAGWVRAEAPEDILKLMEHPDYALAVPTPDHFIPLLYLAGMAAAGGESADALIRGYSMGSLSMTCYGLCAGMKECTEGAGAPPIPSDIPPDQTNL